MPSKQLGQWDCYLVNTSIYCVIHRSTSVRAFHVQGLVAIVHLAVQEKMYSLVTEWDVMGNLDQLGESLSLMGVSNCTLY